MPYSEALAARIRSFLEGQEGLVEKKMFGGIGWTIRGNMACGAHKDGRLMIRCGREDFPGFIAEAGADAMKRGATPMTGWVLVDPEGLVEDTALHHWLARGRDYAAGLPAKVKKPISDVQRKVLHESAQHYVDNARRYSRSLVPQL